MGEIASNARKAIALTKALPGFTLGKLSCAWCNIHETLRLGTFVDVY